MTGRRVLVADDEPYILRSLTYILRKEGFDVREARTGREALEAVKADPPDLVFLDVMMPEVNGFEVCARIKVDPALSGVRIVMLTARGQDQDRGREAGADLYMTKPFSPSKIVELARRLLGGGGEEAARGESGGKAESARS